jgi:Flp pilus assembly protein TadD
LFAVDSIPRWHVWDATPLPDEVAYERLARARVKKLFKEVALKSEVVAGLEADSELSAAARRVAIRLADTEKESADDLNEASWKVTRAPGAGEAALRLALQQARTACEIKPDDPNHLNTLGAALYRTKQFEDARATLLRAHGLREEADRDKAYEDLAFLAMTCHHLVRKEEALNYLERLRALDKVLSALERVGGYTDLLREAEALIEGKANP